MSVKEDIKDKLSEVAKIMNDVLNELIYAKYHINDKNDINEIIENIKTYETKISDLINDIYNMLDNFDIFFPLQSAKYYESDLHFSFRIIVNAPFSVNEKIISELNKINLYEKIDNSEIPPLLRILLDVCLDIINDYNTSESEFVIYDNTYYYLIFCYHSAQGECLEYAEDVIYVFKIIFVDYNVIDIYVLCTNSDRALQNKKRNYKVYLKISETENDYEYEYKYETLD